MKQSNNAKRPNRLRKRMNVISNPRRVFLLLMIVLALVLLSACSGASPTTGRLIVWHTWNEVEAPIIEQVLEDFQGLHPDIKLSVERIEYTTAFSTYVQAARAGLGPDVMIGLESVYGHVLYENALTANARETAIDWSLFDPATLQSVQRDDATFVGVPINAYVSILFYNTELVDQPPTTLDELRATSEEGIKVGLPTTFFDSYWGVAGLGGSVFDGESFADESETALRAWLEWLVALQDTPGAVLSQDIRALVNGFSRGDLGVLVVTSLDLPGIEEALGAEQVNVALLPGYPTAQPFSNVEVMVINRASVQTQAAAELINFVSNSAQQRKLAQSTSGRVPINPTVRLNPVLFPRVSVILQQNQTAVIPTTQQDTLINQLITNANPIYQQVLEGVISPEEGARLIVEAVEIGLQE